MIKLTQDEKNIIEKDLALPKSLIARRLAEILDEMLNPSSEEDFRVARLFAVELRKWLKTIKLFSAKEQEIKKEDFV